MLRISVLLLVMLSSSFVLARPLLLISIDGFTPQYFDLYQPPFLTKLVKVGAFSAKMQPVFPSKTFPNHVSIVTGVYPQKHGIIHNSFYHPDINRRYRYGLGKEDSRWVIGKPIWTIAEQHDIPTGIYFWPESESNVDGITPTYLVPYDGKVPNDVRLQKVVDWLSLPDDQQPQFMTTYFSSVDDAGHRYGIHSDEVKQAVLSIDESLGKFYQKLQEKGLTDLDIILVSDHGMLAIDADKAMQIEQFDLPKELNHVINGQTQVLIYDEDKTLIEQAKRQLEKAAEGRFVIYSKGNYPAHWHLEHDLLQIPDLMLSATAPYSFTSKRERGISHSTHGFDPKYTPEMNAFFLAFGPSFKTTQLSEFQNIDVMPLMLRLLELPISENLDGSVNSLEHILR